MLATGGLPSEAHERIERLLEREVEEYSAAIDRRDSRKLDGGSVAALIVVTIVGALAGWAVIYWLVAVWPVWYWTALALAAVIVVFGLTLGLAAAGITQIWKYPDEDEPSV
ncbi:hypothetical protein QSJ19_01050 [Gordonia sp. ABSL11-1]|uniref:hypothetical protein n=1 Tax=Gordonia sp. ABSL11-1 TaxID=3053924 RepID=UPI002574810A|nr:hypothetical protein [Gordonia sp. ABSL11-1]MDL9944189.1 hypothetical protein [Gordonia sp. ABSL11-1]